MAIKSFGLVRVVHDAPTSEMDMNANNSLSIEFFPPKTPEGAEKLRAVRQTLYPLKPQFELQPSDIGKGGLVKDESSYVQVETRLRDTCASLGLNVLGYWPSAIAGGDGNKEFWIGARRA